jgi:hypothetical protein
MFEKQEYVAEEVIFSGYVRNLNLAFGGMVKRN